MNEIDWFVERNPFKTRPHVGQELTGWTSASPHYFSEDLVEYKKARFVDLYERTGCVTLEQVGETEITLAERGFQKAEWTYRIAALGDRWFEPTWDI